MSDESDDTVLELTKTCDRSPREGLEWIARFDVEQRYLNVVMFSRFIALRKLALRGIFENSWNAGDIFGVDLETLRGAVTAEELGHALDALREVRDIEERHPGYIDGINDRGDKFAWRMVDDVCMIVERLVPTEVAKTLGWTKLRYFGSDRVGTGPTARNIPDSIWSRVLEARISKQGAFRSAIATSSGNDSRGAFIDFGLLERPVSTVKKAMAEAGIVGVVRIFENGEVEAAPEEGPIDGANNLNAGERERLHEEATMLLRYEDDPERVKFLRETIAWLEGRGPKPEASAPPHRPAAGDRRSTPKSASGAIRAIAFVVILGIAAGGSYFAYSSGYFRPGPDRPDREFAVELYTPPEALVARQTGSNFRAMPFAEEDVLVLRESVRGERLDVTGRVHQPDGVWYQLRLRDGRTAYLKGTLVETQNDGE